MLLQENMPLDALSIYTDILKDVSREKDPETYSLIKNSEGRCYYNLSFRKNKSENILRAIECYEESIRFINPQKFPENYALTNYNLGNTYMKLSEFYEAEKSLTKAEGLYL